MEIPLPHSELPPYNSDTWSEISSVLNNLLVEPSIEKLCNSIKQLITKNSYYRIYMSPQRLEGLEYVLKTNFSPEILTLIVQSALDIVYAFPSKTIPIMSAEHSQIELTQFQIRTLLAHQFFCTLRACLHLKDKFRGHFVGDSAPTGPLTFSLWHLERSGATEIYLKSFLNYFKAVSLNANLNSITFQRLSVDCDEIFWRQCSASLIAVNICLEGRIGDEELIEMDFANKYVGFGITATQEELLLGTSPEFCPIVIFATKLEDHECIVMRGAKKFGDYSGYLYTAQYTGCFADEWDWQKRTVIAIDAIPGPGNLFLQMRPQSLLRDLNKAYCGFRAAMGYTIATGHWGCGAFGGNKEVKFILQVLAASAAKVACMKFYCFDDKSFKFKADRVLKELSDQSVSSIWLKLLSYTPEDGTSLFDYLLH